MDQVRRVVFILGSAEAPKRMLGGQCRFLARQGYRVTVIASPGPALERFSVEEGIAVEPIEIRREIAVWHDLGSLWGLWNALRRLRPDIVEAGTPKAGLLGMLASLAAGISCRVYALHGLRLETLGGVLKPVLWICERLTTAAATEVICVSPSLRAQARAHRILRTGKGVVLANGSANGVDLDRFKPRPESADSLVLGFVGRLTADKGVAELTRAFRQLKHDFPSLRLLVVGDFEAGDPPPARIRQLLEQDLAVELAGFVDDPAPYYERMHVVALPSHREGLPFALLEAAASGRPAVSSWATGCIDAVEHGKTGSWSRRETPATWPRRSADCWGIRASALGWGPRPVSASKGFFRGAASGGRRPSSLQMPSTGRPCGGGRSSGRSSGHSTSPPHRRYS